jgi:uncharacterized protein (TIGR02145 family)
MKIITDENKIEDILRRGTEDIIEKESLKKRLLSGKQLNIKLGIDPTGPKIHLGRATILMKLRDFQELGHNIILIIGNFTALIGDASDKDAMRRVLTEKEVKENLKDYLSQIGKILDIKKVQVKYNKDWLGKLKIEELIQLSMNFTAQQMIQRRNFKERWDEGKPIGLHELMYPLLQGYDSVVIKSDVEIGGFDQLFNLKAGRILQRVFNQEPQDVMTLKMIYGLDGRKMSTSWGTGYPIVGIGNQCWMRDNLNYATGSSWCYANNAANCNTYGRLYNWSTAITACPSGWHLPSDAEWKTLEMHLGMTQAQADATGWRGTNQGSQLSTLTLNGTNSSGFTALMSGYRDTNSSFYSLDSRTHFWSSTESGSFAWRRSLGTSNFTVGRNTDSKEYGFSVRCLRN